MNTLDYYNENAKKYFDNTINIDMSKQYELFLKYVREKGKILDFGCGSGRDSLYFKNLGYQVFPIDGSKELCTLASEYTGLDVKCMNFLDLSDVEEYDGIWACATLLHIDKKDLLKVLINLRNAIKRDGSIYVCFMNGYNEEEYKEDGRYFNDLTKESFNSLSSLSSLQIVDYLESEKIEPNKYWVNYILKRK